MCKINYNTNWQSAVKNKPKLTEHSVVKEVAQKLGATEAQVLIAWGAKRGYSVIPKSVQEGMPRNRRIMISHKPLPYPYNI